jgi:hypothetical protein
MHSSRESLQIFILKNLALGLLTHPASACSITKEYGFMTFKFAMLASLFISPTLLYAQFPPGHVIINEGIGFSSQNNHRGTIRKSQGDNECRRREFELIPQESFQKQLSVRTEPGYVCEVLFEGRVDQPGICVDAEGWGDIRNWTDNIVSAWCYSANVAYCNGTRVGHMNHCPQ